MMSCVVQPAAMYEGPEVIPASPAEPEEEGQNAKQPAKVPILPTDPLERTQQLKALHDAGVPVDMLQGS
jgi:hypothetical protein